jgi:AcrR family transcriptional regulator
MARSGSRAAKRKRRPARAPEASGRTRLEVDARRAQLVALGLEFFGAQPYDDVSIDAVAKQAGISKGLIYHYFPTKRAFYVATVKEAAAELLACTEPDPRLGPIERAREGLDAYLGFVERHGRTYAALLGSGIGSDADRLRVVEETRGRFLDRLLEGNPRGAASPRLRLMLRGFVGFVERASLDWVLGGEPSRGELADLLLDVLVLLVGVAKRDVRRAG